MFLEPRGLSPIRSTNLAPRQTWSAPRIRESAPQDVFEAIWKKRWTAIAIVALCLVGALVYLKLATPAYTAIARLYVAPALVNPVTAGGPEQSKNYLATQSELLKSLPILDRVAARPEMKGMKTFAEAESIPRFLKKHLVVELGDKGDLIEVSLDSPDAQEAERIVNAVVESYVSYQTVEKRTVASQVLKILRDERVSREKELEERRLAVLKFKQDNALLALESDQRAGRSGPSLNRLAQLGEAKTAAQLQMMEATASYETVRAALDDPLRRKEIIAAIVTDAALTATERGRAALQNELNESQLRLELMKTRQLGPNNPAVLALVRHIAETERKLSQLDNELVVAHLTSLERTWRAAEQRMAAIDAEYQKQREEILALNATAAQLAVLESAVEQTQKLLEGIEERVRQLTIDGETGGLNVSVLEWAAADADPTKPRKALVLVAACLMGIILGSCLAFVRALTDRRLRSTEQIEDVLGVPVLSAIPRARRHQAALVGPTPALPETADAFSTIRTAIYFNSSGQPIRTIQVTSATKGEGKSTVASNLAVALAHGGERTLLIDADMRRPSLHVLFKASNRTGLSTILNGADGQQCVICGTRVNGLDLLPAGPVPLNPSELLSSPRFHALLAQLSQHYQRIVLDAPPVLGMPDALILGARCDATLLVVRAGVSDRGATGAAFSSLVNFGVRSIATVINAVRPRDTYAGYGGYYYRPSTANGEAVQAHAQVAPSTATGASGNHDSSMQAMEGSPNRVDAPVNGRAAALPQVARVVEQQWTPADVAREADIHPAVTLLTLNLPDTSVHPPRTDAQPHARGGANGSKVSHLRGR